MLLYVLIVVTLYASYARGKRGSDFWETFWIEPGFLIFLLHSAYLEGVFEEYVTYTIFLIGWVVPILVGCVGLYAIGQWQRQRLRKIEERSSDRHQ